MSVDQNWMAKGRWCSLLIGGGGLLLCVGQAVFDPSGVFHAWLFAALFWLGLSMGSAALVMIHHLTGGEWGIAIRRILEAAISPLWVPSVAFLPLWFGLRALYPWARPAEVAADHVLGHRYPYLSAVPWMIRCVFFLAIWLGMGWYLRRLSRRQDTEGVPALRRLRKFSGPGLLIYPLIATFAYLDWVLSLEKHWYSTIFMVLLCVGGMLSALALSIIVLVGLRPGTVLESYRTRQVYRSLGSLLLALVMFWAYLMFSQFLIIWSGNLPHEISWYLQRITSGWLWIIVLVTLLHFAGPFFVLLSRQAKQAGLALALIAASILLGHVLFDAWLVLPSGPPPGLTVAAFAAPAAVGGFWCWRFLAALPALPLLPLMDPRLDSDHD